MSEAKFLVKVDEGVYVDPHQIASIQSVSYGTWGIVRVTLLNGEKLEVRRHDTDREHDPSQSKALFEDIADQLARVDPGA